MTKAITRTEKTASHEKNNIEIRVTSICPITEYVVCEAFLENKTVSYCKVNNNNTIHIWTIVLWFTNEGLRGQGVGKKTLAHAISNLYEKTGKPNEIKYIWNGTNSYVLEWLERNFDAECSCPIAIQKKQADDDWESHIYDLDVEKTLAYFEIA